MFHVEHFLRQKSSRFLLMIYNYHSRDNRDLQNYHNDRADRADNFHREFEAFQFFFSHLILLP